MDISEVTWFLRAAGKRITPERKLLLRIISDNAHLHASEIYRLATEEDPRISLSTVYRTVNLLNELGLVEASVLGEDHYHYEVCSNEHYHLICLGCGKVAEIPSVGALKKLGEKVGFEAVGVKLELVGYCEKCRKKRDRERRGASPATAAERPRVLKKITSKLDLRGVPLLAHPKQVASVVERLKADELLDIITNELDCSGMAPRILGEIEGVELLKIWREGSLRHALVKRV